MKIKLLIILNTLILILALLLAIKYRYLEVRLEEQEQELEESRWYKKRVENYMLINLKQEKIINQYKQTRELSRRDSILQELKLNIN